MIELVLPFPPSLNGYWRAFRGRQIISAKGRAYRSAVMRLKMPCMGLDADLSVELVLYPPDRRKRDIDNYTKAVFDALSHAGFWVDDSLVKRLLIEVREPVKGGEVRLFVQPFGKGLE